MQDYCCWQHDACWQREYDGGNTGVTVKGQIFYCDCDIELSRCADRVRAKCTGRPDEAGCAETHSEALAKAADLSFVFYTLPHIFSAINSVPGIDMGTCAEPAPRADEARPPPAVCVYCTADGERESFAINGGFDCSWQGGAAAPLRELPETACPSELRGMTLATELAGCPDPDAASECGASASGGGGTACVYCGAGGERKTYAINGPLDCAWQGETISLEQLPDASCPSEMDGRALAAQLNACPDPDTASECA